MARKRKLPEGLWERNGTYYARFRAGGRLVRKRLSPDFDAACEILRDMRARADKADFNLIDNDYQWADLRAEFLRWVKQTLRAADMYEGDLDRIERYCKVRSVRQIDSQFVIGYRTWRLGQGVCPRTINREVGTLSNMLNRGVQWKRIGSNPIVDVKHLRHDTLRKVRRALTVEEIQRLFAASPECLKPVWRMFMCTGIRKNELVQLRWDDVDFDARVIVIRAQRAKNHKAREIPLDDAVHGILADLYEQAKDRCPVEGATPKQTAQQANAFSRDHVFVTKANTPLRNNLLGRFYAICKRAGIDDAKPTGAVDIHALRVTFTTLAIDGGANPKAIQEILGHSTLALTMNVYNKVTGQAKRNAIAALPFANVSAPAGVLPVHGAHKVCTTSSENKPKATQVA